MKEEIPKIETTGTAQPTHPVEVTATPETRAFAREMRFDFAFNRCGRCGCSLTHCYGRGYVCQRCSGIED